MNDSPILLAEDNRDDALLTRRAFAQNGIANRIVVAEDGERALAALLPEACLHPPGAEPPTLPPALTPALVLLDVNLPRVSGLEVLARLRADPRTETLPVVMLTTSREERDVTASYRLGANGYVCKPISFRRFVDVVRTLGDFWLDLNESCPPWRGRAAGGS